MFAKNENLWRNGWSLAASLSFYAFLGGAIVGNAWVAGIGLGACALSLALSCL